MTLSNYAKSEIMIWKIPPTRWHILRSLLNKKTTFSSLKQKRCAWRYFKWTCKHFYGCICNFFFLSITKYKYKIYWRVSVSCYNVYTRYNWWHCRIFIIWNLKSSYKTQRIRYHNTTYKNINYDIKLFMLGINSHFFFIKRNMHVVNN